MEGEGRGGDGGSVTGGWVVNRVLNSTWSPLNIGDVPGNEALELLLPFPDGL
jgi:hypothetical protein